jgi:hypothetical protein
MAAKARRQFSGSSGRARRLRWEFVVLSGVARHVSAIHQLVAMREASDVLRQRVVGGAWMKAFRGIGHPSLSIGIKSLCLRLRLYGRLTQTVKTYLAVR